MRRLTLLALTATLALAACGSDDESTSETSADEATTTVAPVVTEPADTASDTSAPRATDPATTVADTAADPTEAPTTSAAPTTVATTAAPTTTEAPAPPDPLQELPGMGEVEVTVAGDATRPTFSWSAPDGAASYQVAVQTADGAPMWAWTGAETEVVLGGEERPDDVEGPALTGPSRVRVYAFDAAGALVAVSGWVALPGA